MYLAVHVYVGSLELVYASNKNMCLYIGFT